MLTAATERAACCFAFACYLLPCYLLQMMKARLTAHSYLPHNGKWSYPVNPRRRLIFAGTGLLWIL
jgi:hypothetical protein